jgi:hypothetical protein
VEGLFCFGSSRRLGRAITNEYRFRRGEEIERLLKFVIFECKP